MTWIIIKQPHPLDRIWAIASAHVEEAQEALDDLPEGAPVEQELAAADALYAAQIALITLPARSIGDCLSKLIISGVEAGDEVAGVDVRAIINEMTCVLDAACQRGAQLKREIPGFLEGVTL